jgi:hypothetical protein
MTAIIVRNGAIERVALPGRGDDGTRLKFLQDTVDGYIAQCFIAPGAGRDRTVVGFCNDEGLLRDDLAWNVVVDPLLYHAGLPVKGAIVIVGCIGPDTVPLIELEAAAFRIGLPVLVRPGGGGEVRVPMLAWVPGYTPSAPAPRNRATLPRTGRFTAHPYRARVTVLQRQAK